MPARSRSSWTGLISANVLTMATSTAGRASGWPAVSSVFTRLHASSGYSLRAG